MRIERIILKNYRQFRDAEFSFNKKPTSDLHVIKAVMGTGKTNFLNAINWCLYEEEPYLSKNSDRLPILNLKAIAETNEGKDVEVRAEVWVKTDEGKRVIFVRRTKYRVYGVGKEPQKQSTKFEVKVENEKGNIIFLEDEEARNYVDRFVPDKIKEFFFFDGERLDRYFKTEGTGKNIYDAIYKISQLEVLKQVHKKISNILRDEIRKKASKISPKTEKIEKELEEKENSLKNTEKEIKEVELEIEIAKHEIEKYYELLISLPPVEDLEQKRRRLENRKQEKEKQREEKVDEKLSLLYKWGKILFLWPAIEKTIEIVDEKEKNKEIPPGVEMDVLEDILRAEVCNVCGRALDSKAKENVEKLLEEIKHSSEIGKQLAETGKKLKEYVKDVKNFESKLYKLTKEIQGLESDLNYFDSELASIEKDLSKINISEVKEWTRSREIFTNVYNHNLEKLGSLKSRKEQTSKEIEKLKNELDEELKKEEKVKQLRKQIMFCNKALSILSKIEENLMKEIKDEIESETKRLFFDLAWKKESFKDITLDNNYNIKLIHEMGYECLGTISGGERELLTLAFTIALHKISGFDSPIIVDRPLAMVSGEPRRNIINVFTQVSKDKQIILLFTPDDYSPDISSILDSEASNIYELKMAADEKEVKLEVLKNG